MTISLISLVSSLTGDAPVFDSNYNEICKVPVNFTSNSFTVRIPLALINGDGAVNTATVLGTFSEPTDACLNGGSITSSSPLFISVSVLTLTPIGLIVLISSLLAFAVTSIHRKFKLSWKYYGLLIIYFMRFR